MPVVIAPLLPANPQQARISDGIISGENVSVQLAKTLETLREKRFRSSGWRMKTSFNLKELSYVG